MGGFLFVIYLLKILMKLSLSHHSKNLNLSPPSKDGTLSLLHAKM